MANLCHKCFFEYDTPGSCPRCGYDATAELGKYPLALPAGSILDGRYIVGRVLGEGGFGITYSAQDYDSKGLVAIKEHFPAAIVTRTDRRLVSLISESMKEAFTEGKEKFLAEAKTISQFNGLDNICDIYSYFEENGTAYFAMEYVNGIPLDEYIKSLGRLPSFEETTRLLLPVMEALCRVHEKGIIHRDIAPDNIMVTPDNKVMLIDFGAARYSMGEKSRSLDVILKHGFAPREQYNRHGRQGAYTDVYAMAATYYYTLTGRVPQDALDRQDEDELLPPTKLGIKMPRKAEAALMKALAVNYTQRWQTMREFSDALKKELPPDKAELERIKQEQEAKRKAEEERRAAEKKALEEKRAAERRAKEEQRTEAQRLKELKKTEKAEKTKKTTEAETPKKKKPLALIAALAAIAIGAGAFFAMGGDKATSPAPAVISEEAVNTRISAGEKINWVLDENGTLTISGEGEITASPWKENASLIKRLVIEPGVTGIIDSAFSDCGNLVSASIPDSVTSIGANLFHSCASLHEVVLSGKVTNIPAGMFYECSSLDSIVIPSSVTRIGNSAFSACIRLTSITIHDSIKSIGDSAFSRCVSLESVVYIGDRGHWDAMVHTGLNGVNSIGKHNEALLNAKMIFQDAPSEEPAATKPPAPSEEPSSITWELSEDGTLTISGEGRMPSYGGYGSNNPAPWCVDGTREYIKKAIISHGITHIGSLSGLPNLAEVELPDSVVLITAGTFGTSYRSPALHTIIYKGTREQWDAVDVNNTGNGNERLFEANITFAYLAAGDCGENLSWSLSQDGTLTISGEGEMNDYGIGDVPWSYTKLHEDIRKVVIEEGVTHIGEGTFVGCVMEKIYIPRSVASIGKRAFGDGNDYFAAYYNGSAADWEASVKVEDYNHRLASNPMVFAE